MFPKRLVLLDPYWRNGKLENSWTTNHPAYVDLGASSDWPAQMTRKILSNVIDFADNDPLSPLWWNIWIPQEPRITPSSGRTLVTKPSSARHGRHQLPEGFLDQRR